MPSPYLQRQFSGPFGIADRGRGAEGAALTGRKGWILPHHAKARKQRVCPCCKCQGQISFPSSPVSFALPGNSVPLLLRPLYWFIALGNDHVTDAKLILKSKRESQTYR
jgi:hypothetical protein